MSNVVATFTGTGVAASARSPVAVSTKAADISLPTASAVAPATKTAATISGLDPSSLAPQVKTDPVAGLITQYIDPEGSIVSQVPSSQVLTYLRAGLTESGMSRQTAVQGSGSTIVA